MSLVHKVSVSPSTTVIEYSAVHNYKKHLSTPKHASCSNESMQSPNIRALGSTRFQSVALQ
eukprot:4011654-Amphidinium_carterae.1